MVYLLLDTCMKIHEIQQLPPAKVYEWITEGTIRYNEQEGNYFQKAKRHYFLALSHSWQFIRDICGSWEQLLLSLQGLLTSGMFHVLLPSTWFANGPIMHYSPPCNPGEGRGGRNPLCRMVEDYPSLIPFSVIWAKKSSGSTGDGGEGSISLCAWSCHK